MYNTENNKVNSDTVMAETQTELTDGQEEKWVDNVVTIMWLPPIWYHIYHAAWTKQFYKMIL